MSSLLFRIIRHDTPDYQDAVRLREEILRKPLGLIYSQEELNQEKSHVHIAGFKDDVLVATAVLVPEKEAFKMQRVVVQTSLQGSGIGSAMMRFCEKYAQSQQRIYIYCHARDSAVSFYLTNQYRIEGAYFEEDTVPHVKMSKVLS